MALHRPFRSSERGAFGASMPQVLLLLFALLATLTVHTMQRAGDKEKALQVDQNLRLVAWVTYLGFMAAVIIFGIVQHTEVFIGLCFATVVVDVAIIVGNGRRLARASQVRKAKLMKELKAADLDVAEGEALARTVFNEFDDDHSGSISAKEAAELVQRWHPNMSTKQAYSFARKCTSANGTLGFGVWGSCPIFPHLSSISGRPPLYLH